MGMIGNANRALAAWSQAHMGAVPSPVNVSLGALADAAGGAADLVNGPTNSVLQLLGQLSGSPQYQFPIGAVQAAVPQPKSAAGKMGRAALAMAMPGGEVTDEARAASAVEQAIGGMIGRRGRAEAKAAAGKFLPAGQVPVVTQAGQRGLPIGGADQMLVQHPGAFGAFHSVKTPVAPHEVTASYLVPQLAKPKILTPEDLAGADVISLYGDRTRAGGHLTAVNGQTLANPVELQGGPDFGRWQEAGGSPAVWASEKSPVSQLRNQIAKSLDAGRDVYGVYTPMGPGSLDQSTMMTDTLTQMLQGSDVLKKHLDAFDRTMKQMGLTLPSARDPEALAAALHDSTQGARRDFTQTMDSADWLGRGFPDVGAARMALTDPNLLDVPAGASGYRLMKFGPETLERMDPTMPHGSYSEQMAGENAGQLSSLVPFDMMFPTWAAGRREAGKAPGSDLRAFEMSKPTQTMTPEAVDGLMDYQQRASQAPSVPQ